MTTTPLTATTTTRGAWRDVRRSASAELLRLRRWPAVWVTCGAWLLLAVLFGYVFDYVAFKTDATGFSNDETDPASLLPGLLPAGVPDVLVQGMPMFGGALMVVLGAIVAGNGYGWGTWKTVFTTGPSRASVVAGSVAALTAIVLVLVAVTVVVFLGVSTVIALVESEPVTLPSVGSLASGVGVGVLVMQMWALFGYAAGTVARGPGLSVGLGLVWTLVIENLLRGVGTLLSPVESFTHVLPGTAAGSLVGWLVDDGPASLTPGVLDVISGGRAAVTVAAYLLLLPLFSLWLVGRRDVG